MADKEPPRVIPLKIEAQVPGATAAAPVYFALTDVVDDNNQDAWADVAATVPAPVAKATESLDSAVATIQPIVQRIIERIGSMNLTPKEIEISLGVSLSGKVGFFVAESQGEASISLKLTYEFKK